MAQRILWNRFLCVIYTILYCTNYLLVLLTSCGLEGSGKLPVSIFNNFDSEIHSMSEDVIGHNTAVELHF